MAQKFEYDVWTAAWGHGEPTKQIKKELNKRGGEGRRRDRPTRIHRCG